MNGVGRSEFLPQSMQLIGLGCLAVASVAFAALGAAGIFGSLTGTGALISLTVGPALGASSLALLVMKIAKKFFEKESEPSPAFPEVAEPEQQVEKREEPLSLLKAAEVGDIERVESLLSESDYAPVNISGENGLSPLHLAAKNGHVKIVDMLSKHPYIELNRRPPSGPFYEYTPFYLAVKHRHVKIAELLLKTENVLPDITPPSQLPPLLLAIENEDVAMVNLLLKDRLVLRAINSQRFLDSEYKEFTRPLHFAAKKGNKKIVKALLKAGANPNSKDSEGKTPLDYAGGYPAVVALLS